MNFKPYLENRNSKYRPCNCGRDHNMKIIRGRFHYSENSHCGCCVGLIEHQGERRIWVSFITGEWPGTDQPDCYVTAEIWHSNEDRIMKIEDSSTSPFEKEEVFNCYPVTREQVLAVDGAKDWFINTYLELFSIESEIENYLNA